MMNNPETDSVFCGFSLVNESGEGIQLTVAPLESGTVRIVDRDSGAAEVFGDYSTMPWNKFFRLKKRGALPQFDEGISLGEDELWELEMLKSARQIALIGDPLYFYRARSHSLSRDPALTPSRLSLLDSQEKVLRLVEAEYRSEPLIRLAQDRLYYKGQELMKEAYYQGQFELYARIDQQIEPVRKIWFANHDNWLGSCRRHLVEWMMRKRLPGSWIRPFDK